MTILKASKAPVNLNKGKPISAINTGQPTAWIRPTDWVTFATPTSSEQKVIGNVAVYNQDSNYIALAVTVSTGTYTVDWGDGTSANFTSGTTAQKNYTWSSISSGTLTSDGYRQAIITVTPTTIGATFSGVNLNRKNSQITSTATNVTNPWLDIAIAAPNATTIAFAYDTASLRSSLMFLCEQINIVAHNTTNMTSLFREFVNLKSVLLFDTSSVTTMSSMFNGCYSLQSVPLFNTINVTDMSGMFNNCPSLQSVPLFNTSSVITMGSMFASCYLLPSVPLFDTISVINMSAMFSNCYSLQSVPLFNTSSVTTMNSMFSNCFTLQSVPLFNTSSVTVMTSMFQNCYTLLSVPLFNTSSVTVMGSMFNTCYSLQSVPLFNTINVTTMTSMFSNCIALLSVPLFNTINVTTMTNMFSNCFTLQSVPLFNTISVTVMGSMFNGCYSLQSVPLFNTINVTTMTNMFQNCTALQTIGTLTLSNISTATVNNLALGFAAVNLGQAKLIGNRWTQSFQNCKMGATQLNEMYTALATLNPGVLAFSGNGTVVTFTVADITAFVTGRTVTVSGMSPPAFNISGTITSVNIFARTFTFNNTLTGTPTTFGIASLTDNRTITVTNNPGTATDTPTIATNKGWTVTGS